MLCVMQLYTKSLKKEGIMKKENKCNLVWNSIFIICSILLAVMLIVFGFTFGTLFFAVFCIALVIIRITNKIYVQQKHNTIIVVVRNTVNVVFLLFIASFLLVEFLIISEFYAKEDPEVHVDYVVILGAGLEGDKVSKILEKRLLKGTDYLIKNEKSKVIVSGGQGEDEDISEAEAMGRYLIEKGIDEDRIYYEDKSTSTVENLLYSKQILSDNSNIINPQILIVTSDYHMFRAKMISKKLNLQSYGMVSESELSVKINYLIREYFVLVKDWLLLGFKL